MKGENPDESVSVKKKNKCRCCLKPFTDDNEANELTVKIVKQFLKLTNVQLKVKSSWLICDTCKKELKYISKLRSSITKRSNSYNNNDVEEKSSFKNSLSFSIVQKQKYLEHCHCCYANDKELKNSTYAISFQYWKLTKLELTKSHKICLLCINELHYLERVRKDFLKIHNISYQTKPIMKKKCYYCKKPFKLEKEINDLTDKNKSNFKEFTGIDLSYNKRKPKICKCCKEKLKFVTHLKAILINNLSEDLDDSCQCCSKKFDKNQEPIRATEKIESQFNQITNKKLMKYSSICNVCKLKLDYVVALQSNLMKNHTPVEPTEIIIKETKKEKLKRKIDEIIDDSMTVNTQSKRRRLIDIKGIEEEPVVEREKTEFDCQYCDRGFNEYDALNHHMNTAHNLNEVQCRKCNDWYKIKIIDENKKITIYEKKIKEYVCDYCVNNSYKTAGLFKAIIPKEEVIPDKVKFKSIKVHKCEICGLVVKGAPTLENHMISLHTDQRPNQCTQCTSAFKTLTDLRKHIRRVHDLQRNAQCTMCPKSFFGNDGLKLHILHAHSDEKNFPCTGYDDCEKTFKNKYILDVHIRRVHLKERNYTCPTCGNGFFTPSEMKYHVKAKHEKF